MLRHCYVYYECSDDVPGGVQYSVDSSPLVCAFHKTYVITSLSVRVVLDRLAGTTVVIVSLLGQVIYKMLFSCLHQELLNWFEFEVV